MTTGDQPEDQEMLAMHQLRAGPLPMTVGAAVGIAAGIHASMAATRASGGSRSVGRRRWLVVATGVGAVAGAAMGARFGISLELAAYLLLVAVAIPASAVDLAVRKVPDRLVLPAFPAAVALLALTAHRADAYGALGRALLAAAVTFTAYLALALITGQLGLGDCKAAGLCGIFLGYLGWTAAALGVLLAFVLAAALVVARTVMNGTTPRNKTLAFAPFIFAGALVAVFLS